MEVNARNLTGRRQKFTNSKVAKQMPVGDLIKHGKEREGS